MHLLGRHLHKNAGYTVFNMEYASTLCSMTDHGRSLARVAPRARLFLVDGAGHTFGAVHPFEGATAALESAIQATRDHFRVHLRPD